jgi:hypothetical protein
VKTALASLSVFAVLLVGGSASSAATFQVWKVSETQNSITLGWAPQPGDGYRFWRDGVVVSRTFDQARTTVKFSKGQSYKVEVQIITYGSTGVYPAAAPPPPPPPPPPSSSTVKANLWVVP